MQTPDVTRVQLVAVAQAVIAAAVVIGAPLSKVQEAALVDLATALAVALPLADAVIRNGRARHLRPPVEDSGDAQDVPVAAEYVSRESRA